MSMRLVAMVVAGGVLALGAHAQQADPGWRPEPPPAGRILDTLRRDHPRLLLPEGGWEGLKQRIGGDSQPARWHAAVIKQADEIVGQPVSEYEIPDGLRLLATSRRVLDRVMTLAYAYRIEGGRPYLDRAWAELSAAAAFPDWNPRHFLDTAEMTCAFGIGYDWLFDAWTEEQRSVLRKAIVELGLEPGRAGYRGEGGAGWWARSSHNWNQVCNGGLAVGALAIAEEEPELAAEIVRSGLVSVRRAMGSFAPDGGWAEGPGYWNYATAYNVRHLAAVESALGSGFGFGGFPGFDRTGEFPVYMSGPTRASFNFADGGAGVIRAPQLHWLARAYGRQEFAAFQKSRASPSVLDVIWGADAPEWGPAGDLPLDRVFRGINVATMRSSWDDKEALFVGFKAGDNRANHSHLDLGSFVLEALGQRWAIDLGSDNYNMPGYFGRQRWTYYRLRAEGHNTLVINPGAGPDQDPTAEAPIVRFESDPGGALAIADLTRAYSGAASSVRRGVALIDGRRAVVVQDEIEIDPAADPADVLWFLHTRAEVERDSADPSRAGLHAGGQGLVVHVLSPPGAELLVTDARPLPTSPDPSVQQQNKGIRKLAVRLEGVRTVRLAVLLAPVWPDGGAGAPPPIVPLEEW